MRSPITSVKLAEVIERFLSRLMVRTQPGSVARSIEGFSGNREVVSAKIFERRQSRSAAANREKRKRCDEKT